MSIFDMDPDEARDSGRGDYASGPPIVYCGWCGRSTLLSTAVPYVSESGYIRRYCPDCEKGLHEHKAEE